MKQTKPTVGILVNPASGRDVRRLVAKASVFQNTEKCNMVYRLLGALGVLGVEEVFMMPDVGGVACHLIHSLKHGRHGNPASMPTVHFLEMPIEDSPIDTLRAIELMVGLGVGAIVVMGGDGTHRLVAKSCGSVPLVTLSTGTNNAFPEIREATVAGLAAGLVAMEKVVVSDVCSRSKILHVDKNEVSEDVALVDICLTSSCWVGTKALWQAESLKELFVTFAESDAVGLSSIAGLIRPVSRCSPYGLRLKLVPPGEGVMTVTAPIAPGLMVPIGIASLKEIRRGEVQIIESTSGTLALDGEREIEFGQNDRLKVWLETNGPLIVDISKAMDQAVKNRVFVQFQMQGHCFDLGNGKEPSQSIEVGEVLG
ncbi:MAG: NAD(+)/NADH kinase [Geobacteraceae bacterium]|nr:NAD(+)/NADH kinase [Geobacteraceae bacterium]